MIWSYILNVFGCEYSPNTTTCHCSSNNILIVIFICCWISVAYCALSKYSVDFAKHPSTSSNLFAKYHLFYRCISHFERIKFSPSWHFPEINSFSKWGSLSNEIGLIFSPGAQEIILLFQSGFFKKETPFSLLLWQAGATLGLFFHPRFDELYSILEFERGRSILVIPEPSFSFTYGTKHGIRFFNEDE